jgi:hypothetical protein
MYGEEELEKLTMEKIYQAQQHQMGNQMGNQMPQMDYGPQEYVDYGVPYGDPQMMQQMGYQMQQMTVPCATVTVVAPALITATNIVVTPGTCTAPCNVNADVTWTNQGGTPGTFTPAISVNGGAPITLPAVTLAAGASTTQTFTLTGLTTGTYTICPVPN